MLTSPLTRNTLCSTVAALCLTVPPRKKCRSTLSRKNQDHCCLYTERKCLNLAAARNAPLNVSIVTVSVSIVVRPQFLALDGPDPAAPGCEAGILERNEPTLNCPGVPNGIGIRSRKIELITSFYALPSQSSQQSKIADQQHLHCHFRFSMDGSTRSITSPCLCLQKSRCLRTQDSVISGS